MDQPAVQAVLTCLKTPPYMMFEECVVEGKIDYDPVPYGKLDLVIGKGSGEVLDPDACVRLQ